MTDASFVDHLQLLPLPSRDGMRQPDGEHRPGGLGLRTLADRLGALGWTARNEDFAIERKLPDGRLAEAYARAIGDAVASARDRNRFPVVLSLVNGCALGVVDGTGTGTGVVWVSPGAAYRTGGFLRRTSVEESVVSRLTGRQARDAFAIAPVTLPGARIVIVGGTTIGNAERKALDADGVRRLGTDRLTELPAVVAETGAEEWVLHVDATAFAPGVLPAADRSGDGDLGLDPLADAVRRAFEGRRLGCVAITRYDLNRESAVSAPALAALLDRILLAAGGQPDPSARRQATAR
jgi:arginase family enzyme